MIGLKVFQVPEGVMAVVTIQKAGVYYDPVPDSGSAVKVDVYNAARTKEVDAQAATKDSTGHYSYKWVTTGKTTGTYTWVITATDGAVPIVKVGKVRLEASY